MNASQVAELKEYFHKEMDTRFQEVDKRFQKMDTRFQEMGALIERVQTRIIQWVVGLFISGIVVVTTIIGLYTAYLTGVASLFSAS